MTIKEKYQKWLDSPTVTEDLKIQLEEYTESEIEDAFYTDLAFGTAGIRGKIGPGTNRLNVFIVKKATIGFAMYLLRRFNDAKKRGVVISHDNRLYSREFTLEAAKVLNSYGIKAYIFDDLRPTPELSFAVRRMKAVGGIMITASHNPKEYNGYKVYDEHGCQLVPDKIEPLVQIISDLDDAIDLPYGDSRNPGKTITLSKKIDEEYVNAVLSIQLNKKLDKSNLKIVFSPQHGTSLERAKDIFDRLGYNVTYVKEQCFHDPLFSSTKSPNPEAPEAFELPLKYARRVNADIVICTDPDADRLGCAFKDKDGNYTLHTGNQTGALLINYILSERQKRGLLKENSTIYDTVVTSSFGKDIAKSYNVQVQSLLTGFKYIGEKIHEYEKSREKIFEFGYEESYGYLIGQFVRDKDSLQAIVMILEMTNYYLQQGKTLDVVYTELEEKLGYHHDKLFSIYFEGQNGVVKMKRILDELRLHPIKEMLGSILIKYEDYQYRIVYDHLGNKIGEINLPVTNLIKYYFEDGSTIAVRPSGTEPKCKFYYGAVAKNSSDINGKTNRMHEQVLKLLKL